MKASVPKADGDAFEACYGYVGNRACGGVVTNYQVACMSDVSRQYAAIPNRAGRRTMLLESGCPSPVVDGALTAR